MGQSKLQQFAPLPGDVVPKYRYRYFSVNELNGWAAALVGSGGGDPIVGENTTSSITGLRPQANGDDFAFLLAFPDDVNVESPIDLAVIWSSNQTTVADTYAWTLTHREITLNSTSGMDTAAGTAFDTTLATDTNLVTASAGQMTAYATINGGTLSGTIADGYLHQFLLDFTTNGGTVASDLVIVYGVLLRYQPKLF